ncbi:urease-like [Pyrus ussuriensis x Pyrus communis]|uniref:Urease-like n=1 Tax=Pyrus ussuriensis x Pyrus communis TaxID=2448454 RepID=A0A5N5HA08_9ROSA|nr:urease-like [Pyrus ussuriensis x Pyrus communis]
MKVVPREAEKLNLNTAGFLAQERLARGLRLNHPEAAALIATQETFLFGVCIGRFWSLFEMDKSVAELMDIGRQPLGRKQVLRGVQYLLDTVQVLCSLRLLAYVSKSLKHDDCC